ncbi:MAG: tRNA (mo5U34)-methyltransferase [Saprospiraceae bacterium]|jgi:tRNA (mo5U34)-methyltransferase
MDLKKKLNIAQLVEALADAECRWAKTLEQQVDDHLANLNNGNLARWIKALDSMPQINECDGKIDQGTIELSSEQASEEDTKALYEQLHGLKPWRKGPFNLFGIDLNTEWRSDSKWSRIQDKISPLKNKTVLDIGCANGYFGLRMAGAGAKLVVGVDPSWLFTVQFMVMKRYLPKPLPVYTLPFTLEAIPRPLQFFDSVFSMGVLYHRRSPFDHFMECFDALRPGGELVMETLVIEEKYGEVLVPKDRYARMRNVWFIPNTAVLCAWLERVGFESATVIDESDTTTEEQRATEWMQFESLDKCLDPNDPSKTVEGYPAPRRAAITAKKPL